jgi:hypothetical protein
LVSDFRYNHRGKIARPLSKRIAYLEIIDVENDLTKYQNYLKFLPILTTCL